MAKNTGEVGYASLRSISLGNLGSKAFWPKFQSKIVDGKVVALSPEEAKAVPHELIGTVMGKVRDCEYREEQHPTFGLVKSYVFEGFFEARSTDPKLGVMRAPKFFPPFAFGAEIDTVLAEAKKTEAASDVSFIIEVYVKGSGRAVPIEYYAKAKAAETQDPFASLRKLAIRAGVDVQRSGDETPQIGHDPETGEIIDAPGDSEVEEAEPETPVAEDAKSARAHKGK